MKREKSREELERAIGRRWREIEFWLTCQAVSLGVAALALAGLLLGYASGWWTD